MLSDMQRFCSEVLPQFFKHAQFASFLRQLNHYGFATVAHKRGSWRLFEHPLFRRGSMQLERIRRRPVGHRGMYNGGTSKPSKAARVAATKAGQIRARCAPKVLARPAIGMAPVDAVSSYEPWVTPHMLSRISAELTGVAGKGKSVAAASADVGPIALATGCAAAWRTGPLQAMWGQQPLQSTTYLPHQCASRRAAAQAGARRRALSAPPCSTLPRTTERQLSAKAVLYAGNMRQLPRIAAGSWRQPLVPGLALSTGSAQAKERPKAAMAWLVESAATLYTQAQQGQEQEAVNAWCPISQYVVTHTGPKLYLFAARGLSWQQAKKQELIARSLPSSAMSAVLAEGTTAASELDDMMAASPSQASTHLVQSPLGMLTEVAEAAQPLRERSFPSARDLETSSQAGFAAQGTPGGRGKGGRGKKGASATGQRARSSGTTPTLQGDSGAADLGAAEPGADDGMPPPARTSRRIQRKKATAVASPDTPDLSSFEAPLAALLSSYEHRLRSTETMANKSLAFIAALQNSLVTLARSQSNLGMLTHQLIQSIGTSGKGGGTRGKGAKRAHAATLAEATAAAAAAATAASAAPGSTPASSEGQQAGSAAAAAAQITATSAQMSQLLASTQQSVAAVLQMQTQMQQQLAQLNAAVSLETSQAMRESSQAMAAVQAAAAVPGSAGVKRSGKGEMSRGKSAKRPRKVAAAGSRAGPTGAEAARVYLPPTLAEPSAADPHLLSERDELDHSSKSMSSSQPSLSKGTASHGGSKHGVSSSELEAAVHTAMAAAAVRMAARMHPVPSARRTASSGMSESSAQLDATADELHHSSPAQSGAWARMDPAGHMFLPDYTQGDNRSISLPAGSEMGASLPHLNDHGYGYGPFFSPPSTYGGAGTLPDALWASASVAASARDEDEASLLRATSGQMHPGRIRARSMSSAAFREAAHSSVEGMSARGPHQHGVDMPFAGGAPAMIQGGAMPHMVPMGWANPAAAGMASGWAQPGPAPGVTAQHMPGAAYPAAGWPAAAQPAHQAAMQHAHAQQLAAQHQRQQHQQQQQLQQDLAHVRRAYIEPDSSGVSSRSTPI